MEWTRESGSFRDPSGFVFTHDGVVFRQVNADFGEHYQQLIDSGLYDELVRDGLLVAHEEVDLHITGSPPPYAILRPSPIPFISYPYEWCFGQYKAAALLTLELHRRAIGRGMTLRDASAYNVQFAGGRPIFIDTLSFGTYVDGEPWSAYRQFCQHFLNPLALMALVHPSLGHLGRVQIDGIPLDLTARLLPASSRLRPGLLTHVHLHKQSLVSGPKQHARAPSVPPAKRMGKTAMLGLVESLARTVQNLSWKPADTFWSSYTDHSHYSTAAQEDKAKHVAQWLDLIARQTTLRTVWDLGANTGAYSRIAADRAALVVSFDLDHVAVERHFQACCDRGETRILPLVQDFANPSAAIGWHHVERHSLVDRGPADAVLALALVHHLAIGNNVPLPAVARFFRDICRYLIVEFVPKEDAQIRRMLTLRQDVFTDYSRQGFEAAFAQHYETLHVARMRDTERALYLMRRRIPQG